MVTPSQETVEENKAIGFLFKEKAKNVLQLLDSHMKVDMPPQELKRSMNDSLLSNDMPLIDMNGLMPERKTLVTTPSDAPEVPSTSVASTSNYQTCVAQEGTQSLVDSSDLVVRNARKARKRQRRKAAVGGGSETLQLNEKASSGSLRRAETWSSTDSEPLARSPRVLMDSQLLARYSGILAGLRAGRAGGPIGGAEGYPTDPRSLDVNIDIPYIRCLDPSVKNPTHILIKWRIWQALCEDGELPFLLSEDCKPTEKRLHRNIDMMFSELMFKPAGAIANAFNHNRIKEITCDQNEIVYPRMVLHGDSPLSALVEQEEPTLPADVKREQMILEGLPSASTSSDHVRAAAQQAARRKSSVSKFTEHYGVQNLSVKDASPLLDSDTKKKEEADKISLFELLEQFGERTLRQVHIDSFSDLGELGKMISLREVIGAIELMGKSASEAERANCAAFMEKTFKTICSNVSICLENMFSTLFTRKICLVNNEECELCRAHRNWVDALGFLQLTLPPPTTALQTSNDHAELLAGMMDASVSQQSYFLSTWSLLTKDARLLMENQESRLQSLLEQQNVIRTLAPPGETPRQQAQLDETQAALQEAWLPVCARAQKFNALAEERKNQLLDAFKDSKSLQRLLRPPLITHGSANINWDLTVLDFWKQCVTPLFQRECNLSEDQRMELALKLKSGSRQVAKFSNFDTGGADGIVEDVEWYGFVRYCQLTGHLEPGELLPQNETLKHKLPQIAVPGVGNICVTDLKVNASPFSVDELAEEPAIAVEIEKIRIGQRLVALDASDDFKDGYEAEPLWSRSPDSDPAMRKVLGGEAYNRAQVCVWYKTTVRGLLVKSARNPKGLLPAFERELTNLHAACLDFKLQQGTRRVEQKLANSCKQLSIESNVKSKKKGKTNALRKIAQGAQDVPAYKALREIKDTIESSGMLSVEQFAALICLNVIDLRPSHLEHLFYKSIKTVRIEYEAADESRVPLWEYHSNVSINPFAPLQGGPDLVDREKGTGAQSVVTRHNAAFKNLEAFQFDVVSFSRPKTREGPNLNPVNLKYFEPGPPVDIFNPKSSMFIGKAIKANPPTGDNFSEGSSKKNISGVSASNVKLKAKQSSLEKRMEERNRIIADSKLPDHILPEEEREAKSLKSDITSLIDSKADTLDESKRSPKLCESKTADVKDEAVAFAPLDTLPSVNQKSVRLRRCAACNKQEEYPKQFRKCSKCSQQGAKKPPYYCGRECQVKDWKARHSAEHCD